jgi:glycosyltransferase involved in cell wall biosynthesis
MAGNDTLAEYARRHAPAVSVVPTTIDTDLYVPRPAKRDPGLVIGWMGSYSTGPYLERLRTVLPRLARRFRFRFLAVGARGFEVDGVDIEVRPWRAETELQDLGQLDIGVMPLPDAPWERGKCGLKALQYMALGVPAVVSPVGVNRSIIAHGQNGLLADTEEDWERELGRLLADVSLRRQLGQAGRLTVEHDFSARVHAPRVAGILRGAARARRRPTPGAEAGDRPSDQR